MHSWLLILGVGVPCRQNYRDGSYAACGCGDVHSTRHGGRRPSMAERVSGCGDAHTRAERLDGSGPAVCRWSEWHEMRAIALWRMRVAVMKLTGSKDGACL